jgi:hypothetical protein
MYSVPTIDIKLRILDNSLTRCSELGVATKCPAG